MNKRRCQPPLEMEEVREVARKAARQPDRPVFRADANRDGGAAVRWKAETAREFLRGADEEPAWLVQPILVPGAITEIFAPRGIGKSVVAMGLAVTLAQQGRRILLLDRDNSRWTVRTRLQQFAGDSAPKTLHLKTRETVPPLTDADTWRHFPHADYDLVILDSLDAAAEGIGEKDSAKPSRAIAPLLDIARREGGPAILVLGNTV